MPESPPVISAVKSDRDRSVDVSVVLPVYNEKGHLEKEIDRIDAAMSQSEFSYEIVVVDDGSTDGSSDRLRELEGIRLVQYGRNRGSGFARHAGSSVARGDVVVWTDVDMTYPNERIPELVRLIDHDDQVVGARTSEQGTVRLLRIPAKWTIRKFAEFLVQTEIPDLNSGMRAFRREVMDQFLHLMPNGFSHVTTMTMAFLGNDYSVGYMPIAYSEREGQSKFHWFTDTQLYALQVTRMVMLFRPMRVFMPLSLTLILLGVGKLVFDLISKDFRVATNTLVIFILAVAVLIVGLLADLIVQLSKSRNVVRPAAFAVIGNSHAGSVEAGPDTPLSEAKQLASQRGASEPIDG